MAKTEVILTHNIVGLGGESDQVKVAAGYARNYLFPQRLAIPVTHGNKRHLEALQQRRAEREAHELNTMTELSKGVAKLVCVIKVKTGDDGKLFGAVTAGMIADELKNQYEITLDKKKIHLEQPIRALGEYEIELHLHHNVKSTLKVRIESTTPIATSAETSATENRSEKPHTEKRGKRPDAEKAEKEKSDKPEKSAKGEKAHTHAPEKSRAHEKTHAHEKKSKTGETDKKEKEEKPATHAKAEKHSHPAKKSKGE